ncbi:MAG: hypothetical protein RLY16_2421 [Bacteroidota bacterium]|jgi:hypothetical protein
MRLVFIFVCSFLLVNAGFAQQKKWQQQLEGEISVTLLPAARMLDGDMRLTYFNHSPDTLHFIWMHLWANAYKNDRTFFTDQSLSFGDRRFYFSREEEKGYINRLQFRVNQQLVIVEDHPAHQEIVKIILPTALLPGGKVVIETPFHLQLPQNINGFGFDSTGVAVTQWLPKPAVYDQSGWHPMPYVYGAQQYTNRGAYKIHFSIPANYQLMVPGQVIQEEPMAEPNQGLLIANKTEGKSGIKKKTKSAQPPVVASPVKKTLGQRNLTVTLENTQDVVWWAGPMIEHSLDTCLLPDGKVIQLRFYNYKYPNASKINKVAIIQQTKLTLRSYAHAIGPYPYSTLDLVPSICENAPHVSYPGALVYAAGKTPASMQMIAWATGKAYLNALVHLNAQHDSWILNGINTWMQSDISLVKPEVSNAKKQVHFLDNKLPKNENELWLKMAADEAKAQKLATHVALLNRKNSLLNEQYLAGVWFDSIQQNIGKSDLQQRLKALIQSGETLNEASLLTALSQSLVDTAKWRKYLYAENWASAAPVKKQTRVYPFFNFNIPANQRAIFWAPIVGFNHYDRFMPGIVLHNYQLPAQPFQFLIAPMYSTGSADFSGMFRLSYHKKTDKYRQLEFSLSGASFNHDDYTDSTAKVNRMRYSKLVPGIKLSFFPNNPNSHRMSFLQWRTFFIQEQGLNFGRDTINDIDVISYPKTSRYLNQLRWVWEDTRALYPFKTEVKMEQGQYFVRLGLTGNYFFNYPSGGGVAVRLFAGKFFYLGEKTYLRQFETDPYHLNMSGPKGYEDYTYENYYVGRNEFQGWQNQQIMQRDGFFKVRTDLLGDKIGKSDDWLTAINFTTDLPKSINPLRILPVNIPVKLFLDIGTYAAAWQSQAPTGKFIFDAGLQLSLFKGTVNVYMPLLYSKVYSDYFKSTLPDKRFLRNISFSIDVQHWSIRKLFPHYFQ